MTRPRYGLGMIVKDEHDHLRACLESVKPHIGYWVISDTGSTDDTKDIIREVLGDIPGKLLDLPFVNFGHNRSEVFALAHQTADWIIALDADMTVEIDTDFEPNPLVDAYMIRMGTGDFEYRLPLLLSGRKQWQSIGAVHEYTALMNGSSGVRMPTDAVRVRYEDRSSPTKSAWQAGLLEAELAKHPDDARSVFYLAQTLRELGRIDESRALYYRRAAMGGFAEEAFYAAYRGALLEPAWPDRMAGLAAAWEMRPTRIEPLYDLVRELNARGQHHLAYRLASTPIGACDDALFVHRYVWAWGIAFERSIAAWWVGENAESLALCNDLLANPALPDFVRAQVEINRGFAIVKVPA